jgi:hypothetical protein
MKQDAISIALLIRNKLATYAYEAPSKGTTLGEPWSESKVAEHIEQLKQCLVTPHLERFLLAETAEHSNATEPTFAEYWVIATTSFHVEWYDPSTDEFGLAEPHPTKPGFVVSGGRKLHTFGGPKLHTR